MKPKGTKAVGAKLCDLAAVVRSKNAGVNEITFDLIFTEVVVYEQAKASPALDKACVEKLLGRPVLGVYCDDTSLAIKITCDRVINAEAQVIGMFMEHSSMPSLFVTLCEMMSSCM